MRKILFLLCIFMGVLPCISQAETYTGEMLREGMYWKYREYSGYEDGEIIGSKTINDKVYGLLRIHRGFYDGARASEFDDYFNWTTEDHGVGSTDHFSALKNWMFENMFVSLPSHLKTIEPMARPIREKSGTCVYHVMLRGINRQDIF